MAKGKTAATTPATENKRGRKAGKSAVPADETKAQKFIRLGIPRVEKSIKAIDAIGNLAASGYESTPEQREKIITALKEAVERIESRFNGTSTGKPKFTL